MGSKSLVEVLREQPFLTGFDAEHIERLAAIASEVRFAPGQIIFREGGESDFFYLILSGNVALETRAPGRVFGIQTLGAGDEVGWSSMLVDVRAQFHARALTAVEALALPSSRMLRVCEENPALGYALMRGLLGIAAERLKAMQDQFLAVDMQFAAVAGV